MSKISEKELQLFYGGDVIKANLMASMSILSDAQEILHQLLGIGTNHDVERVISTINHAKEHLADAMMYHQSGKSNEI